MLLYRWLCNIELPFRWRLRILGQVLYFRCHHQNLVLICFHVSFPTDSVANFRPTWSDVLECHAFRKVLSCDRIVWHSLMRWYTGMHYPDLSEHSQTQLEVKSPQAITVWKSPCTKCSRISRSLGEWRIVSEENIRLPIPCEQPVLDFNCPVSSSLHQ